MYVSRRVPVIAALGTTQTLAWASSYYLPAMLAAPMAKALGVSTPTVFAAFSFALGVSALLGPYAGRCIDRWGGRPVLMATNAIFAAGLALLGSADSVLGLFAAWAVIGIGMGSGLYEAAFATLVRLYGRDSRGAISGITLIAGFASTVGWPLSTLLEAHVGWRGACFAWAALHLFLALPLNGALPRAERGRAPDSTGAQGAAGGDGDGAGDRNGNGNADRADAGPSGRSPFVASVLLAVVFAVTWFISTAMAAHLPRLLVAGGATVAAAVAIGALVGPAQVGARLLEVGLLRRFHPLLSARLAAVMHPIGAVVFAVFGPAAAAVFVVFHGAGNGILTIAKGTLPLELFGPAGYGERQGFLMVPARIAQALAPWLFGLCLDRWGVGALWVSGGLSVVAVAALAVLRGGAPTEAQRMREAPPLSRTGDASR
ncbi:MAG: MFS transporter [Gammaproteobacteria bacterium]|nr:MFS transporter [Gammaproteobacteria bacterium]